MVETAPKSSRVGRRWPRPAAAEDERPLRILVCDDEPAIVRLIQVNLRNQGYEVHAAADGRECLQMLSEVQPDICILDILMPFVDGFEVLRKLRRDPSTNDIYVALLTTSVADEERARGIKLGADQYLTKPFEPNDIKFL